MEMHRRSKEPLVSLLHNAWAVLIAAALLGSTFMGLTALGLLCARDLTSGDARKSLGLMTAAFGLGQILGPAFAGLLAGSFVVETIFQIPGLGRFYVQAAFNRDYTMILGTTVFLSTLIVLFNLLSDILAAWMNPRLRAQFGEN